MCLQLLFAFVACLGAEFFCEPAHIAARCVLAAVVCLCGLLGAKLLCEPAHVAARCVLAALFAFAACFGAWALV